jgi:hypothetical protein
MTASWVSQRVPPMGAIKAEGIKRQLGRPTLDRLTVLVREAAQNSWDAGKDNRHGPVHFGLDLRELEEEVAGAWRRILATGAPTVDELPLRSTLERLKFWVLFVSDRGTSGLGGPTRADEAMPDRPHDYVSFVLNVGDPRDTEFGGGTYGFGKAVFYRLSTASTIVVHTRCRNERGEVVSRLVACALGHGYARDGHIFTGRHWFGVRDASDVVQPVSGEAADAMAAQLGFPPIAAGELGTTVAVLAPELDGRTADRSVRLLADSVLWHLWPKMVGRDGGTAAMTFRVALNGEAVEISDPAEHPVLREFVAALNDLGNGGETIPYGSGAIPIGKIAMRTAYAPLPVIDDVGSEAGLGLGVHHCCLLRAPELVVEYRQGPPLPDEHIWYAGVFKVLPEHDEEFANAEPPTHDAWLPDDLDIADRSVVRTTLRKIDIKLKAHASPANWDPSVGGAEGLAAISRFLGVLLAPAPGQAAGPTNGDGRSGGIRTRVRMVGNPHWEKYSGDDVLVQEADIEGALPLTVEADISVRVWGGSENESEAPTGAMQPRLLAWRGPNGATYPAGRVTVGGGEGGRWQALVVAPRDTATRIRIREAKADNFG